MSFNGGKWQTQSTFLQLAGDYFHLNLFKTSAGWVLSSGSALDPTAYQFDANGYPTLLPSALRSVFFIPNQAARPGNYVLTWTGGATVVAGVQSNGTLTVFSSAANRLVYTPSAEVFEVYIEVQGLNASTVGDIRWFHEADAQGNDEALLNAGEIVGVRFASIMAQGEPGVYRFLDQFSANTTAISTAASCKPEGHYSYQADQWRNDWLLGATSGDVTTASGTDYKITSSGTIPSGDPVNGQTIHLKLVTAALAATASVTASVSSADIAWTSTPLAVGDLVAFTGSSLPAFIFFGRTYYVVAKATNTFQVSDTLGGTAIIPSTFAGSGTVTCTRLITLTKDAGRKIAIRDSFSAILATSSIDITQYKTAVYSSRLDAWLLFGAGTAGSGIVGIVGGIPPTIARKICTKIGAHPHLVTPFLAVETDYITTVATDIKNNGPAWMKPRFEGPNETWNTAFRGTSFGDAFAQNQWGDGGNLRWYGYAITKIGTDVAAVYGGGNKGVTYDILCGVNSGQFATPTSQDPRLKNSRQLGMKIVDVSLAGVVTMHVGGVHGKSIGDLISFSAGGGAMPSGLTLDQKYFVLAAGFSTTQFNFSLTANGAAITITPATPGLYMYDSSLSEGYNFATVVCPTTYWSPASYTLLYEGMQASIYANNGNSSTTLDAYVATNYIQYVSATTASVASNVLTVSGSNFISGNGNGWSAGVYVNGPGIPAPGVKILSNGTGAGGDGTYNVSSCPNIAGPIAVKGSGMIGPHLAWQQWGAGMSVPVTRVASYEGGYGSDVMSAGQFNWSPADAVTRVVNSVWTCSHTHYMNDTATGGAPGFVPLVGNIAVTGNCGVPIFFTGTFAPFNGKLFNITNVSGNTITTDLDTSSAASNDITGGLLYFGPPTHFTGTIVGNTLTVTSPSGATLRGGESLFYAGLTFPSNSGESSVQLQLFAFNNGTGTGGAGTYTLTSSPGNVGPIAMTAALGSYEMVVALQEDARNSAAMQAATFQLCTDLGSITGSEYNAQYALSGFATRQRWLWGMWNNDIYGSTPPAWSGYIQFNGGVTPPTPAPLAIGMASSEW